MMEDWSGRVTRLALFTWEWQSLYYYSDEQGAGGAQVLDEGITRTRRGAWRKAESLSGVAPSYYPSKCHPSSEKRVFFTHG